MASKPIAKPQSPPDAAAAPERAAAAFADGRIDPPMPPVPGVGGAVSTPSDVLQAEREIEKVSLSEAASVIDPAEPERYILIICQHPGFRRAGITHPRRASYPLDAFTAEQLELLFRERALEVIEFGGRAVPRAERLFGADPQLGGLPLDARAAGDAAADAISRGPNRAGPGLRNAVGPFASR